MGICTIPLPGTRLAESVAGYLLRHHADALPDLSGLTLLVPNHRAGQDLARELSRAAGSRALIPPRIMPLKAWAERLRTTPAEPSSRRLERLHAVLRKEKWLGDADKWALANELLTLADELSAARLGASCGNRIRALHGTPLDRETALIEAVWRALNNDGSDPQACYAAALERLLLELADEPPRVIYAYALGPLTGLETGFLERCAEHAPLHLFELDGSAPTAAALHAAWKTETPAIRERARELALDHPASPFTGRLSLCPAAHLEGEARGVAAWVASQLQAGRRSIALIALDRQSARRTRALLQRLDVLVADETGWVLSTTAAAAVVDRWLECIARDFPYVELLDLLKSPFLLAGTEDRQDAVLGLELAMRRHGVAQGMAEIHRLAKEHAAVCLPWLGRVFAAARAFPLSRAPLSVWLDRLGQSLAALDATTSLGADAAGAELLSTLERLRGELVESGEKYGFAEWRRWLDLALESDSFVDAGVVSPVVLTSLPAARGRSFEAVAVIGADSTHLPPRPAPGLISQASRAHLGLATAADAARQATEDLLQLLSQGPALLSWQAWQDDQPNAPSPLVTRLQSLHRAAWGCELPVQAAGQPPARSSTLPQATPQPAPSVPAEHLPRRYSPTAYQTLLDCPYRFFARNVLALQELDEADEAPDRADYGSALHQILKRFHDADPPAERDAALQRLARLTEEAFAAYPPYPAAAWRAQWEEVQPAYVDAWLAQRAEGWHYQSGETEFGTSVHVAGIGEVELHGRVDRIDSRGKTTRVIDYKTSRADTLRKKLREPAEAVQLPFYAWLARAEAIFLPIGEPEVAPLALDEATDIEAIALRLPRLLEAIAAHTPLPANGVEAVCRHCEARGLCRKGTWDSR